MLEELPNKGKVSRSIGPIWRELLNDVRNLTYLVETESEVLHTVKEKLGEIKTILKSSIKKEEKFLLEPQQTENRKRKINLKSH